MQTKITKTLSAISLRGIYILMILSMLLAGVGVEPVSAASPSTISGNAGVGGATVTWNGSGSGSDGSTTADSSGNYSFQVTYSWYWSGTVTPSKTGYTFSPSSRTYNFLTSNQTNQNYTATPVAYTISGSVGSAGGGAAITYTGGSTTANASTGNYSFTVSYGWSGTVTPTKTGYTFSPDSRSYTNVTSNQTSQNYTATLNGYMISGNVGTGSATITYTGGSTTSNSSGDYSFFVSPGWSGTATPSRTGYSFWPASRTYTNVTANQAAQNYTPRPTSFTFGSFADSHNEIYFNTTAAQLSSLNPALVIANGDIEDNGASTAELNTVTSLLKSENLFNKTFISRGNHDDKLDGSAALWESYFETSPNIPTRPAYVANKVAIDSSSDNLTYSFDYGNSIFISLDVPGDIYLLTQTEVDFLDARLTYAENAGLTHAFIFFHGPEYCVELEHCTCGTRDNSACTPPSLMTVINDHPIVSATFHGHEHVMTWTHMDNTRVSDLSRSYEQFVTSPAGASSYSTQIYPDRVDYAYTDLADDDQAFATVSVNGLSFTVNFYETGITQPVWSHVFSKLNTPPTISDITDKTTNEDTTTGAIAFTVGDVELNPEYLTVTAISSDLTLVPAGNISLGGSGANRTIDILPASNLSGSATITVSVNDGDVTVDDTFILTVNAVNDAPVADPQSVSMPWNTSTNIVLTGSDIEESSLTFEIVDNPVHGSLSGSGASRQYTPTAGFSGTDSFTFKTFDGELYSVPATASINVTAFTISGNVGVGEATLSYIDGTTKTVTADGSGNYSFQVPTGWSGTVTPSKAGYNFSPASMSYTNVQADQTQQNYSISGVMITISGNAGVAGATLSYTDGTPKTAIADDAGLYSLQVSYNWSGTVTPSKTGYDFIPASRTYTNLTEDQSSQDYTTTTSRVWYVDKTNAACTDIGQVGSFAVPFCTISRGAYLAQPGQIVHVLHGTYAETIYPERSGTDGNPITYVADPGVTVTGQPGTATTSYYAFGLGSRNYIVIDGFTITNTSNKGIYVDASNHVTIINNHISNAGATSQNHPYEQGIYLRNTTYSTISGNTTDHNTCIGIRVVGGDHNLISNNISYENFSLVETDAAGIELTGSSYNTVINNLVYSNEDSGINLYYWDGHGGASYNVVVGNLSYENGDHGIDSYQSPNNWIIGNTVQGNGTVGINLEGNAGLGSYGSTVENNIMSQNGTTPPSGSWGGNLRFDSNSITGTTTDYNLFYRTDATVQIIWNNANYTSLAAFKAAVPTQEVHGLEGNPLFVNPVAPVLRQTGVPYNGLGIFGNYYTSAGSQAIDSANADAPYEQAADIVGNGRLDDPGTPNTGVGTRTYDDRGAYEYLPAGPSLPIVTTQAVTNIAGTTATGNGTVTATGLPNPTQHGVVWGLTANPTVLDNKTVDGPINATGPFTSSISDLTPGTLYHVRAYATNDVGTVYGEDVTFTTLLPPAVTTQAVTNITATTATGNGNVTALGVPNPTQHGVVWNTTGNPTTADNKTTDGSVSAIGAFTSAMTGLTPGTLYHVRAYATNDAATVYGDEVSFTTLIVPTITTQPVTNILTTTAVGNGNVTFLGIPNPTQHGVVWATTANPTTANSHTSDGPVSTTGAFTSTITGLTPNTLYHVRAYATNSVGTVYGEDVTFTTLLAPTVTTQAATNINTTTATGNGTVTVLGSSNPTQHGVAWSTSLNPTIADNKTTDGPVTVAGSFTSSMTGLTPGTLYHVRAYATNDAGTSYGTDVTFTTLILPTVTTQTVTNITQTTAMGNGTIVSLGVPNPTQYGFVWDINANPTVALSTKCEKGSATVTGAFTCNITGLALGQTYHIRAYATNAVGTAYGEDSIFTTLPSSSTTTTPVTNARTGADVSGTGTGIWINPGNITAADSTYATVTLSSATSHYLEGTNYGFALPSNATINGIQVTIGRYESGQSSGNDVRDSVVSLMKSSTLVGNNKGATSTEWPLTNTAASYGANNDLWGTTWTVDDINSSGFGAALSANSSNNRIAYVDYIQIAVTYTVSIVSSTTTVNCGTGTPVVTYGSSITCVATVVRGSGTFTPTGTVSWTTSGSGNFVTSPCALSGSNGTATCSVSYTPDTVGSGSHLITATYSGDPSFNNSNGSQTVTINKKDASVTPDVLSKTYGDADPALTGTLTGFLSADNVTATYNRAAGETVEGSPYTISATLSPSGVLANYNITYNTAAFTVNKKTASVTVTAASKTYGDVDPTLTGTLTGFLPADNVTASYSRTTGETVAGGPYTISATLSPAGILGNYNITNTPADFTIDKKDASVTVTATSKTYGDTDPTLTGVLTGFLSADNVTATYSRTAGETVADGPYTISATLSPAGVLGNYNITNTPADFTINKKDASVTPDALSKIIGTQDPALTGTLTDFLPADVVTAVYSRAAGEAEGTYPITATLSPTGVLGNYNVTHTPVNFTILPSPVEYTLTINITGHGTVTKSPDKATYHYGDVVTLTSAADLGWSFFNWSANAPGGIVTIQGDTTVTALFTQDEYTLTTNMIGNGTVTKDPNQATYHYGDVVTLTETPDLGWSFGSWSGNVSDGRIEILGNATVTATFIQDEYTLTVVSDHATVTKSPDQATYHYGDEVTLTLETVDSGWTFTGWMPELTGNKVTIQGNTTVTANFSHNEYTLTVNSAHGTVTRDNNGPYYYGDVVTLTMTDIENGWTFAGWTPELTDNKVTIQGDTTVTANFTQDEYALTVVSDHATITKSPDQATYHYGDEVTLTLGTVDPGWTFTGWTPALTDNKVTIQGNTTVTANFTQDEYILTVVSAHAAVTKSPDQLTYHYGDEVILTLGTVDPGWTFTGWTPELTDNKVTIHGNTTVTATFTQNEYTLTIDKVGNGTVEKSPDQATYHYGDIVALTATPDLGWSFGSWSGNVSDARIEILGDTTVTATFTQDEYTLTIDKVGNGTVEKSPDQATYHYGDVVDLTATADPGWSFGSWSANATGGTVTINGNTIVTATFTHDQYTLTITKVGYGTVTKDPDVTTYFYGDHVLLTANADLSWEFTGWSGDINSVVSPYDLTIDGSKAITATFRELSLPAVTTQAVTDITTTTAIGNGNISDLGVPAATQYGVVWDTVADPTIALSTKTEQGVPAGTGAFTSNVTGLTPGTLYHVRAYATNSQGTVYGQDVSFTALIAPTVTTQAVSNITSTTATGNGFVNTLGVPNPTEHGVVWSTSLNPTIADDKTTDGPVSATGAFTSAITGLTSGTLYHVRAYATNAVGTVYGDDVTFTTLFTPTVTTQDVTAITTTTATGNGNVTNLGLPNPTQYGVVWDTTANPTIALSTKTEQGVPAGTGAFTSSITGLAPYTLYHVRAYATNAVGTAYGDDVTFTTLGVAPTVTTQAATSIGQTTAIGNGNITALGVPNPTDHGVCWATTANPTIANSHTSDGSVSATGPFTSNITGLAPNTLYHVRAYATNASGTSYGSDVQFTTGAATQVTYTSSGTWIAPAGVTSVTVEVWGGGGRGGSLSGGFGELVRGGGGGGAYSIKANIPVTPGQSYTYVVGLGSTSDSSAGGDSYFINSSTVLAKGGSSAGTSTSGAAGGATGSGVGDTKYAGGSGAGGNASGNYGGGGGSSAGTGSNGATATNQNGATAPSGGGNGGNGRSSSSGNGTAGSTPGGAGGGAYRSTGTSSYTGGNGANGQIRLTYTVAATSSTTSINCGAGTPVVNYGSPISCVVTVTRSSGTATPTGTVSWTSSGFGSFVTSPCTLSGSGASASCTVTYTPNSVGSGSHLITASYSGDGNFLASSGNQTVTVNKAAASVTPNALSKTYGDADPTLTGSLVGFIPADNVTATYSRVAGETVAGGPYTISATLSPTGVLVNYNITYNTADFTISKKDASVTPDAATKTLGQSDPALTGTLTGFLPADSVTATYSRVAGETVEGSPYAISAELSPAGVLGNYNITYNTASFTITPPTEEYTLTIDIVGNGTVTPDKVAPYYYGDIVTLTATPAEGSHFVSWSENVVNGSVTFHGNTTVTATFAPNNGAPSFTSTAVTTVDEDATYAYNIVVTDLNAGDTLTITAPTKPAWLTFTDNGDRTATLTGTPTNAEIGSHDVVLHVSDGTLSAEQPFTIVVANTNDLPSFTSTPVTEASEDTLYTYNITTTDPDAGAALTITAPVIPDWLALTDNGDGTAVLTGTPANANVGINNITLNVTDGTAGVDQTFTIDVGNANDGPSFTSTPVITVDEDAVYAYDITATDPDANDTLAITAPTLPGWLTFTDNGNGSATLSGTPTNSEVGEHPVALQVTDGVEIANQPFTITVVNVNDAPVLAQPTDQNNAKGDVVSLQLSASDVDAGVTLTYSASGLPAGLSIDPASGLISGTITADPDTYEVTASVDDGDGGTDSKPFNWTVTETAYILTIDIVGNGTVTPDKVPPYHLNDVVVLTAVADENWTFSSWDGCTGAGNTCSITMDGNKTVTATFMQSTILPAGTYDDTVAAWTYTGNWGTYNGSGPYLNTLHYSAAIGDSASVSFNGEQFQLTYTALVDRGIVDVYIDGSKAASINESGPGSWQQTWTSDPLQSGIHTVRFENVSGGVVDIDAIKIIATANILSAGKYDDAGAALTFTTNWYSYAGSGPYDNTLHFAFTAGETAQFSFTGQQFSLIYTQMAERGVVDVYIDGVKAISIDESGPGSWQQTWTSDPLPSGIHTVRLVSASGTIVDLDAIKIMATATILPAGKYDDADARLLYSTNWYTYDGPGPDAGTLHFAFTTGESALISFTGRQFSLTYTQMADRGVVDVYIDGVKVTSIDESGTGAWQQTWTSDLLPAGNHNVRLVQASAGVVDIDAIQVIATPIILSAGTYDDTDPAWNYSTYWYTSTNTGPYNDTLHFTINPKDSVLVSFSGTQFALTYTEMSDRGTADVYVDGVKVATLDENGPGAWQRTWTSGEFAAGIHTMRLVHVTGSIVDIDAITVMP